MTEEEAKTKWCPFAQEAERPIRAVTAEADTNCIGSACMAWRRSGYTGLQQAWDLAHAGAWINAIKAHRAATGSGLKDAKDWVDKVRSGHEPRPTGGTGYCGLAGKP